MTAFIRSVGPAVSTSAGTPLTVVTSARFVGDVVVIAVMNAFPNDPSGLPTTSDEVFGDHGLASIGFVGDTKYRFRLLAVQITGADDGAPYVLTRAPGLDTGTDTIFTAKAVVLGGVLGGLAGLTGVATSGTYTAAAGATPSLADPGDAGVDVLFGLSVTQDVGGVAPGGYTIVNTETMGSGLGAGFAIYQGFGVKPAKPSNFGASPANGRYAFIGFSLAGIVAPSMPASAPAALLRLGCAESYQVFITYNEPATQQPKIVDAVGWSRISWSRVLDEISSASVTIPDDYGGVFCCAGLGGLVPWRFGLRIERNDQLVWEGPVVDVGRPTSDHTTLPELRVEAQDLWSRYTKRLATHNLALLLTNVDAGYAFAAIQASSSYSPASANGFVLPYPFVTIGTGITREVVPRDFEIAWDIMKDLLNSALDGYIMNGVEYLFQPGVGWRYNEGIGELDQTFEGPTDTSSGELLYGLFTESAYRDRPGWSMSGLAQANQVWEPGADTGEEGARRFWTAIDAASISEVGVLDVVDPNPLYRSTGEGIVISDATFQRRADSMIQQRSQPPAVVSGGALSDDAPIDVENLRPGAIWRMDLFDACFGQLLQNCRLKRVSVDVSRDQNGLVETVSPTLFPVGYTEANLA